MTRKQAGVWLAALAVSAGVHGVMFFLMLRAGDDAPPVQDLAAMDVELMVRKAAPKATPEKSVVQRTGPAVADAPAARDAQDLPVPRPPTEGLATAPGTAVASPDVASAGEALVLNPTTGCHLTLSFSATERRAMTPAQLRACEQIRLASPQALEAKPNPNLDASQGGRFKPRDRTPYLVRKPKNECKPNAAVGSSPWGTAPVVGLACGFDF